MSLYPPLSTIPISEHIIEKDGSKTISTGEAVKFGEMSFRMITDDPFDIEGFKLKENTYSPTTGIKVNLDAQYNFNAKSTFRFTDETASRDADLTDLVVSSGEVNEENPDDSTYKEYTLDPIFNKGINDYTLTLLEYLDTINITATQSDAKSTMKIKVPKHDSDGNLVYDSDGTTIIYEEKDISDTVPSEVTLNKLGEPDTEITIKVTAEDGVTENTYKVVIKRPYGIIKGSIYTKPTAALGIYKSNIRLYNSNEVAKEIDWDTIQTGVTDNIHNTLLTIKSQDYITKDDGTYEIYVIPGTYDILIDKAGYLDHIYASKTITEGVTVDLGNKDLIAGDLNKDGVIEVSDLSKFLGGFGTTADDETFQSELDFNEGGSVEISDLSTFLGNYQEVREIK